MIDAMNIKSIDNLNHHNLSSSAKLKYDHDSSDIEAEAIAVAVAEVSAQPNQEMIFDQSKT